MRILFYNKDDIFIFYDDGICENNRRSFARVLQ